MDSIIENLSQLKSRSQRMLDSVQDLNFDFKHQTEYGYADRNATDADNLMLQMQNVTAMALMQDGLVNQSSMSTSDLQNNLNNQQIAFVNLTKEFELQQQQLAIVQRNITAVKVRFFILFHIRLITGVPSFRCHWFKPSAQIQ